jgi:hypothetical protein
MARASDKLDSPKTGQPSARAWQAHSLSRTLGHSHWPAGHSQLEQAQEVQVSGMVMDLDWKGLILCRVL